LDHLLLSFVWWWSVKISYQNLWYPILEIRLFWDLNWTWS
jgi:hypothetical protein